MKNMIHRPEFIARDVTRAETSISPTGDSVHTPLERKLGAFGREHWILLLEIDNSCTRSVRSSQLDSTLSFFFFLVTLPLLVPCFFFTEGKLR